MPHASQLGGSGVHVTELLRGGAGHHRGHHIALLALKIVAIKVFVQHLHVNMYSNSTLVICIDALPVLDIP